MLFQLLTGVLPFRGESMAELMYKIANVGAEDVRVYRIDLGEPIAAFIKKALSKEPELRFQSGATFSTELLSCMTSDRTSSDAVVTDGKTPPQNAGEFERTISQNTAAWASTRVSNVPDVEI
jgi:serine/threonine-protein kinase